MEYGTDREYVVKVRDVLLARNENVPVPHYTSGSHGDGHCIRAVSPGYSYHSPSTSSTHTERVMDGADCLKLKLERLSASPGPQDALENRVLH
uniref:Uncharacterized protein n=1 Tax=Knipowitschia caucasica TaxID=637954 RepID=A0AAV2JG35_KNICA